MEGKEIVSELGKSALGLLVAGIAGWLLSTWKKPSREEFDALRRELAELRQTQSAQGSAAESLRVEMHALARMFEDGLKQIRTDIRELRGERARDTDDR